MDEYDEALVDFEQVVGEEYRRSLAADIPSRRKTALPFELKSIHANNGGRLSDVFVPTSQPWEAISVISCEGRTLPLRKRATELLTDDEKCSDRLSNTPQSMLDDNSNGREINGHSIRQKSLDLNDNDDIVPHNSVVDMDLTDNVTISDLHIDKNILDVSSRKDVGDSSMVSDNSIDLLATENGLKNIPDIDSNKKHDSSISERSLRRSTRIQAKNSSSTISFEIENVNDEEESFKGLAPVLKRKKSVLPIEVVSEEISSVSCEIIANYEKDKEDIAQLNTSNHLPRRTSKRLSKEAVNKEQALRVSTEDVQHVANQMDSVHTEEMSSLRISTESVRSSNAKRLQSNLISSTKKAQKVSKTGVATPDSKLNNSLVSENMSPLHISTNESFDISKGHTSSISKLPVTDNKANHSIISVESSNTCPSPPRSNKRKSTDDPRQEMNKNLLSTLNDALHAFDNNVIQFTQDCAQSINNKSKDPHNAGKYKKLYNLNHEIDEETFTNWKTVLDDGTTKKVSASTTSRACRVQMRPLIPICITRKAKKLFENYEKRVAKPKNKVNPVSEKATTSQTKKSKQKKTKRQNVVSEVDDEQKELAKEYSKEQNPSQVVRRSQRCSERYSILPDLNRRSTSEFMTEPKMKKKILNRKRKRPSIVCTRLHKSEVQTFMQIVKKLGSFHVEDEVTDRTTHLVVGEARRTINLLRAIIRGCWIVRHEWIFRSLEASRWLPEEDFELTEFAPSVQIIVGRRLDESIIVPIATGS